MNESLEQIHFERLLSLVFQRMGLDCSYYKESYLKRRIAVRMRATKVKTYQDYEKLLKSNSKEYNLLLDRLTINVSQFFRDTIVFKEISKLIIPELIKRRRIKIWSAGCANGEEAYSLAMLMNKEIPASIPWTIVATDVDPGCLERAKTGAYKEQSLIEVPLEFKMKHFEKQEDKWMVDPRLKIKINFKIHDLTQAMPNEKYDLILCRNVLIYFLPNLQEKLFKGFHKMIAPDGFMILGKTETLLGDMRHYFYPLNSPERIYQYRSYN